MKRLMILFLIFGLFSLMGCTNEYAKYAGTYSLYKTEGYLTKDDFKVYTIKLTTKGSAEIDAITSHKENGQYVGTKDIYEYRIENKKIFFWNDKIPEFEQRYEDGEIIIENFSYEYGQQLLV